jgi:hypothetical protein
VPSYLLDTDVIIDVLNGKRDTAAMLHRLLVDGHSLGCCAAFKKKAAACAAAFLRKTSNYARSA